MKTLQIVQVNGAILKKESIAFITKNVLPHTFVAEADQPYSGYYGVAPFHMPSKPNSLFLFTAHYYTLQEVLRFAKLIELSCMKDLNIAVSVVQMQTASYPSIRVKHFPDYKMIYKLQDCFLRQGVEFAKKVSLEQHALIKTNKMLSLEEHEPRLFFDQNQANTGYIALSRLISDEQYEEIISDIRNNTSCPTFDAARGTMMLDDGITDIVRIFSGHFDLKLLQCIQEQFEWRMR